MLELSILFPSVLNGLTTGAVYALIALGLTLIYGVLHIINFAHGAALMIALYGVYFLNLKLGIDPYLALPVMVPAMFAFGYALQRFVIGRASHGKDENILLVTLGLAIILENLALYLWRSDTRSIDTPYTLSTVNIAGAMIGGLLIGVVESVCGLWLGESLGQIGIFLIFVLVLLFRPQGLFGARA
jgi:branched-chain amino acid transport system permease protein